MLLLGGVAVLVTFFVAVRLLLWEPHLSNYDMIEAPSITATVGTSAKSTQSLLRDVTKKNRCPSAGDLCTKETCQSIVPSDSACTADKCRTEIFTNFHGTKGSGGTWQLKSVQNLCSNPQLYNGCQDLMDFTGLSGDEFYKRMMRLDNFHFEGEHMFWNPQTPSELAWFYAHSVNYVFGNAMHTAQGQKLSFITQEHAPVLDYSGGAGNNILYLAKKGIHCQYFGIAQMEKAYAEYRFRKRGYLENGLVTIISPHSKQTQWKFSPVKAALPRDGSLGVILAMDVLEHIPEYHKVVEAMVDSIRIGGYILEITPFNEKSEGGVDVHLPSNGISMTQAMGPRMKKETAKGNWVKIAE